MPAVELTAHTTLARYRARVRFGAFFESTEIRIGAAPDSHEKKLTMANFHQS
jgi:hypothetical protein